METMYYIGLDVHKKTIDYCVKDGSGRIYAAGSIRATRLELDIWMKTLPRPWTAAMEATIFTAWIYDHLQPHAAAVKVAHPLMLRAIAVAKKKNDRIDAKKIADCLRCDFLPECYMASTETRERRRTLRYRNLLVRQKVQMKNKIRTHVILRLAQPVHPARDLDVDMGQTRLRRKQREVRRRSTGGEQRKGSVGRDPACERKQAAGVTKGRTLGHQPRRMDRATGDHTRSQNCVLDFGEWHGLQGKLPLSSGIQSAHRGSNGSGNQTLA